MKIIRIFANSCILHVNNNLRLDNIEFMYFDDLLDCIDFLWTLVSFGTTCCLLLQILTQSQGYCVHDTYPCKINQLLICATERLHYLGMHLFSVFVKHFYMLTSRTLQACWWISWTHPSLFCLFHPF